MSTVLYIHGLESGPQGSKARALAAAGFTVVAGQMPSAPAAIRRDPVVIALAVTAIALVAAAIVGLGWIAGLGVGAGLAFAAVAARPLLVRRMFRRSVAVQLRLLAANPIDVVVGSSFGGAVALALLERGAWTGPTVLLCPAHRLVAERAWAPAPGLPAGARVVVVHGSRDEIVPLDHSRALVAGTDTPLIVVDDDHRLSATATAANLGAWVSAALRRT